MSELLPGELLLPCEPELLPGTLLELPLVPVLPGDSAAPVAEPGVIPKYEKMLCRQLGCEMSGQLDWLKEGALCSLLWSPVNTKLSCEELELELELPRLEEELPGELLPP